MLVLGAYGPKLDAKDAKLLTLVAERLVAKGEARGTDTLFERVVEPEAVLAVAAAHAEPVRLAVDIVLVDSAVRERLEAYKWGRRLRRHRGGGFCEPGKLVSPVHGVVKVVVGVNVVSARALCLKVRVVYGDQGRRRSSRRRGGGRWDRGRAARQLCRVGRGWRG